MGSLFDGGKGREDVGEEVVEGGALKELDGKAGEVRWAGWRYKMR